EGGCQFPVVLERPQDLALVVVNRNHGGYPGGAVVIDKIGKIGAEHRVVRALAAAEFLFLSPLERYGIHIPLLVRALGGLVIEGVVFLIDPVQGGNFPRPLGYLLDQFPGHIVMIDVVITVLLTGKNQAFSIGKKMEVVVYIDVGIAF